MHLGISSLIESLRWMFILNAGSITFRNALFLQAAERRYCLKTDVNSGRAWEYQRRLFQDTHRLLADHFEGLDSSELNARVCRYHERLAQQSCAVLVRERPAWGNEAPVLVQTQNQVALKSPSTGQVLPFSFDACASPTDSQRVVWSKINGHALVENMVDGPSSHNGETIGQQITILAYGQRQDAPDVRIGGERRRWRRCRRDRSAKDATWCSS